MLWGHQAHRIFILQKKAITIIYISKYNVHRDPIFKKLKFVKLNDINKLQQLTCTTYMHNLHAQLTCTTYMHNLHAQLTWTTYMHNLHAQLTCTTYMHNLHAQLTCTTYMHNLHAQLTCTILKFINTPLEKKNMFIPRGNNEYVKKYIRHNIIEIIFLALSLIKCVHIVYMVS